MMINLAKLRELADFLAKSWSANSKVYVVIGGSNEIPHVELHQNKIVMPALARMRKFRGLSLYDKYRIWRYNLWHESCHLRYNSEMAYYESRKMFDELFEQKYGIGAYSIFNDYFRFVFNAIEDYHIELLGTKEFPGMRPEVLFAKAIYRRKLKIPENDLEIFAELLLAGKVPGGVEIPDYVMDTVEYVKQNVLRDPVRTIAEAAIMLLSRWNSIEDAREELYRYKFKEDPLPSLFDDNVNKISRFLFSFH